MTNLLTFDNVHTYIGNYHILQGVSFDVPENQVTMLLGRNGAGKTTTMRTIMKLWQVASGSMTLNGASLLDKNTREVARMGVSYIPENMGIFATMSVEENMKLAAVSGPIDEQRLQWLFELFPAIKKFWYWPAGNLSGGQKQMLAIARAVIEPCRLLLVDEPSKGLAPSIIESLINAFDELKALNTTILMVEQNARQALKIAHKGFVLAGGKNRFTDTGEKLLNDPEVAKSFLGG